LEDVVFVGGWVQALYVLEAEGARARVLRTTDIDVTLASKIDAGGRPPLLDLLREAGFEVEAFDDVSGYEVTKDSIAVDLLAEGPSPGQPVRIDGQPDLRVFGYPYQALLRTNTRLIAVGPEVHESLTAPVAILVPTLPAYTLGKLLSSNQRTNRFKRAKDLAYLSELMGRDQLATQITEGLPEMIGAHAEESELAKECLESALRNEPLIADVAQQIIESSGYSVEDDTPVRAQIIARLRRLLGEGWG
jgi:hypothetical protein